MPVTIQPHQSEAPPPLSHAKLLEFRHRFQQLYKSSPSRATRLFLMYVGSHGLDPLADSMAFWATCGTDYIAALINAGPACTVGLSCDLACLALRYLGELDRQFLIKLCRYVATLNEPEAILRALQLVPALDDCSILIPWLRSLVQNSDSHVRSRAAKLLCQLRPNKGLIERHMKSPDARVRASVVEALWQPTVIRETQEMQPYFRAALADPNHRVVANALVGLYRSGETDSVHKMITLSSAKQHLFRAATAWALGAVDDSRALPVLQELIVDPSFTVRQRASSSLLTLSSSKINEAAFTPEIVLE